MASPSESERFRDLFKSPSVEGLVALTADEFERFVADVFRRAGYEVTRPALRVGHGHRLHLRSRGENLSGVVVIYEGSAESKVDRRAIRRLRRQGGEKSHIPVYGVTAGSYEEEARGDVRSIQRTYLLDGARFCRYVRYIRGSRYPESTGVTVVIPPDLFATEGLSNLQSADRPKVLVVANNKGGVGKTTTARHLGLNLADKGLRVLLMDLDPQGNLTEGLLSRTFLDRSGAVATPHVAEYFAGQSTLPALVRPTSVEDQTVQGLHMVPAHSDLGLLDTGGAGRPHVEVQFALDLAKAFGVPLQTGIGPFDWIIIDTPPAVSLFTRAALCAADYVIVPARSRPSTLNGIRNLFRAFDTVNELRGMPSKLLGCLVTLWQGDQQSRDNYARLEELFNNRHSRILATYIPFDVTVEKTHGQTRHKASDAYNQLAEEVLSHVQRS